MQHGRAGSLVAEARGAVVSGLLGLLASGCATPPATPTGRDAIVAYADRWANSRNPNYVAFDSDCTNFVSQSWYADGRSGIDLWGPYSTGWRPYGTAWNTVRGFVDWVNRSDSMGSQVSIPRHNPGQAPNDGIWSKLHTNVTPGYRGDAVVYRNGNDPDYWTHVNVIVDTKYVSSFRDPYRDVVVDYDATVDLVDGHTNDRYRHPWNIGFMAELKALTSAQMQRRKQIWDAAILKTGR